MEIQGEEEEKNGEQGSTWASPKMSCSQPVNE